MERRDLNAFPIGKIDHDLKLALARDLRRLWSSLLTEPLPPNLQRFIDRLDRPPERRH
jgi:hypothetical protein